jgi:hypothetical protein
MPVKKSIRRKKSTVRNSFAWTSTWTTRSVAWTRTSIARLTELATSMDRSMVAAVVLTGGIVVALLLAGYRTPPPAMAPAGEQPDTSVVIGDGIGAPRIVSAQSDAPAVSDPRLSSIDAVATSQMVTIAGCLAQDGDSFRLKDTSGTDAPRSRSWKSGFLKKSPAAVEVVDASHRLRLTNHVGERVSVTGTITDGEMQVRSLRRVANSCSDNRPKLNA